MYTYGDGWIMPTGCPDPVAAWEIIGSMTGATGDKDVYTSLFTTWQCVNGPVSKKILDWPAFKDKVVGMCPGYQEIFLPDLFDSDYYLYPAKIPTSASYSEHDGVRVGKGSPGREDAQGSAGLCPRAGAEANSTTGYANVAK